MMDNHAKRNLRGLVASAIFAAMLGLGSGTASASLIVTFEVEPDEFGSGSVIPTTFESGDFTFEFLSDGDGGTFDWHSLLGEAGTAGIEAVSSGPIDTSLTETVEMTLTGGGDFFFISIWINNGGVYSVDVIGELGLDSFNLDMVLAGVTETAAGGSGTKVDTLLLSSGDFFLIFDNLHYSLTDPDPDPDPMMVPEPGTIALFVTGLFSLGLLSRRRRRSA